MKRDMELVRKILQHAEADEDGDISLSNIDAGHSIDEIELHVELMAEAGLVDATITHGMDGPGHSIIFCKVNRLTWDGHEFLEASRKDTRWNLAKKMCIEQTGGLSLSILKEILKQIL